MTEQNANSNEIDLSGVIETLAVDVRSEIYTANGDFFGNKSNDDELETEPTSDTFLDDFIDDFLGEDLSNGEGLYPHQLNPDLEFSPYNAVYNDGTYLHVDDKYLASNLHWKPDFDYNSCLWKPRSVKDYRDCRRVYLDIETLGLDPLEEGNRIIMIGLMIEGAYPELDKRVYESLSKGYVIEGDEKQMLDRLFRTVAGLKPDAVVFHNGFNFDLPFIIARSEALGIDHPLCRLTEKERFITAASMFGKPISFFPVYWTKPNWNGNVWNNGNFPQLVDTMHLAGQHDKIFANMTSYGLKYLAHYVGYRKEKRLELKYHEIVSYWKSGDPNKIQLVRDYLIFDLEDQRAVTNFFLVSPWYQQMYFPLALQEICVASPARKHNANLDAFYKKYYGKQLPDGRYYQKPVAQEKLKYGGGHVDVNPGLYQNFFKVDVSSLYPSITLRYCLMSTSKDPLGVFLKTIDTLRSLRYVYKDLGGDSPTKAISRKAYIELPHLFANIDLNKIDKPIFKGCDNSLKVGINGGYGFEGTGGYNFNDIESAALITAYGRIMIKDMEIVCNKYTNIVSIDTDGIFASPKKLIDIDQDAIRKPYKHPSTGAMIAIEGKPGYINPEYIWCAIQEVLPSDIIIDLETNCPDGAIYAPKMKNYLYWESPDKKPKAKGVFRKRNRSELQKAFPIEYLRRFAFESKESANEYFNECVTKLAGTKLDRESVTITRVIEEKDKALLAANLGIVGETVSFYWGTRQHYTKTGRKNGSKPFPIRVPILQELPDGINLDDIDMQVNLNVYVASSSTYGNLKDNVREITFTQRIGKADKKLTGAGIGEVGEQVNYFWASIQERTPTGKLCAKRDRFPVRVVISEDEKDYSVCLQDLPFDINRDDIVLEINREWYLADLVKMRNDILKVVC